MAKRRVIPERYRRGASSQWDKRDAWAALDAARDLVAYQGREDKPSYIQRAIEMRYDRGRAGHRRRAGAAFEDSVEEAGRGRPRRRTSGRKALLHVAGLRRGLEEREGREAEGQARWEFQQRAIQGRWEVGEGRKREVAGLKMEQDRRARNSKVFNDFRTLWENASTNPAMRKHWKELLGTYLGGLSPREREWLEPHMKGGPTDPEVIKDEQFVKKVGERPDRPQLREGEAEDSPEYKQRMAEWYHTTQKYDWRRNKHRGIEPGKLQESMKVGVDDEGNSIFATKEGNNPAYMMNAKALKYREIEKELKMLPGTLEKTGGKQWGKITTKNIGHGIYSITPYFDHTTGKPGVKRELIGQKPLKREDLRMSIPNPPQGFEDFQTSLIGGLPPDETPKTEGGRMYSTAHTFRQKQMDNKGKKSTTQLDKEFRQTLEKLWPGHVVRYKYDKGTAKPSERTINPLTWGKGSNIFGDNPDIQLVPGNLSMVRHPKKEGVWIKVVYDSTRGVIYAPDNDTDSWEPAMTDVEYNRKWGEYPLSLSEYRAREGEE